MIVNEVTVPLEEVGPGTHVLGHVGLTEEGYQFLVNAVCEAGLNGTGAEHVQAEEILRSFLVKDEEFIHLWLGR